MTSPGTDNTQESPAVVIEQQGQYVRVILDSPHIEEEGGKLYPYLDMPVDQAVRMLKGLKICVDRALAEMR